MSYRRFVLDLTLLLLIGATSPLAHAQNAARGARLFKADCSVCHADRPNQNLVGPSLFGVVNRPAGSVHGFHYSTANRQSGLVWDPKTLDRYLTAPRQLVPGTLMTFPGLKDSRQRADVIAYLETLH